MTQDELSERLLSITGHTDDLGEALDEMESMRTAIAELFDDNQALEILNKRMRVCLTLAETIVTTVQSETAMFVTEKTRAKINQFFEQYEKLQNTITLSKEIIKE